MSSGKNGSEGGMAVWLFEQGIGEARAGLIEGGRLVEIAIEWDDDPAIRAGAVLPARLVAGADATGRGEVRLDGGVTALLAPVPAGLAVGASLMVEIVREALPEVDTTKPPHARPAAPGARPAAGPSLHDRLAASAWPVRIASHGRDPLEEHGWSEALEEAASGIVARPDVLLRISPTPAMTLIDVDGALSAAALAASGARAAGEAIRRFDIAGSIGIDLPTLASRTERLAAAAALDAALPPPFERTAVNGFGFLQVIRRRVRPSLVERLKADPMGSAARALLRRGERAAGSGALTLAASRPVVDRIARRPEWIEALARAAGATVTLQADTRLAISAGHASRAAP